MEQGKTQRLRLYQDENTGMMWLVVMNSEVPCGLPDAFFSDRIGDFARVRQGESLLVGRISAPSQNILGRVLSRMAVFMKRTLTTSTAQPPRLTPCLCDAVPAPAHESVSGLHGLAHPCPFLLGGGLLSNDTSLFPRFYLVWIQPFLPTIFAQLHL